VVVVTVIHGLVVEVPVIDLSHWLLPSRGRKRPVVKLCSPYPRLFFFGITGTLGVDSCVCLIFTTRVDPSLGSTFFKLILFEKSRVELEFVFLIFTTRVRKHLGNSGLFPPLPVAAQPPSPPLCWSGFFGCSELIPAFFNLYDKRQSA
jgi:hypothetical protein